MSPTAPARTPRLASIEAARALAALAVVLMHATHLMRVPQFSGHVALGGMFDFGYVGVDFFFVLSGFIITYVHHAELGRGAARWPGYLWKRFVRVFPIYWLVLAMTAGPSMAARWLAGRTPVSELGAQDIPGTLLLWIGGHEPEYVGVAWSLQYEVLFYLSFCVLLLHLRGGLALYGLWAALVVAQAFGALPGALPLKLGDPHCLQFLMGVATGLLARRAGLPLVKRQWWLVGAAFIGAVLYERLGAQGAQDRAGLSRRRRRGVAADRVASGDRLFRRGPGAGRVVRTARRLPPLPDGPDRRGRVPRRALSRAARRPPAQVARFAGAGAGSEHAR